jgi:hypothetical protein
MDLHAHTSSQGKYKILDLGSIAAHNEALPRCRVATLTNLSSETCKLYVPKNERTSVTQQHMRMWGVHLPVWS